MRRAFPGSGGLAFVLAAGLTAAGCGDGDPRLSVPISDSGGEAGAEPDGRDGGAGGVPGGGEAGQGEARAGEAGASVSVGGAAGEAGADAGSGQSGSVSEAGSAGEGGSGGEGGSAGEGSSEGGSANEGGVATEGGVPGQAGAAQAGETGDAGADSGSTLCDRLEAPDNGSVDDGGATLGAVAEYSCDRGYRLELSGLRACRANGTWSGTAPTCDRLTCNPISFPDGMVAYTPPDRGCDAEATFTCNSGTLSDEDPRFCTCDSGVWEPAPPTCD